MESDTFDSTIRAFKHAFPFRPFTVALLNGVNLEIDYPDALAIRDGAAMFWGPGRVPVIFDHNGVVSVSGDIAGKPID